MHVGMEVQAPRIGVQHGGGAEDPVQLLVVEPEFAQGPPRRTHQQIVAEPLVGEDQSPQLSGQGEGHHEIGHRQQLGALALEPLLGFVVLTVRTAAVTAGVRDDRFVATVAAFHDHHRAALGATIRHRIQSLLVRR